jgi:hypothetical protein
MAGIVLQNGIYVLDLFSSLSINNQVWKFSLERVTEMVMCSSVVPPGAVQQFLQTIGCTFAK